MPSFTTMQEGHIAEHNFLSSTPFSLSRWAGTSGDGTVDNTASILTALADVGEYAGEHGHATLLVPPGIWNVSDEIPMPPNTWIWNQGTVRYVGPNNVGHMILIQDLNNGVIGGTWDSNNIANTNTIAIGYAAVNTHVHNLRITNAPHGGAHVVDITDPADIGHGGGKGITVQHGCDGAFISDVVIENCDLGFSVEAINDRDGWAKGIFVNNMQIKDCRYMGMYLTGSYAGNGTGYIGESVMMANVELVNCATGMTSEASPRHIADLMGAITLSGAYGLKASNIIVRATEGKTTVMRGSWRLSDWDVRAIINADLGDVINTHPADIYLQRQTSARHGTAEVAVSVNGDFTGHLFSGSTSFAPYGLRMKADVSTHIDADPQVATTSTDRYSEDLPSTCRLEVFDEVSGAYTLLPA